jgi:RadC-like JAB domain
MYRIPIYPVRLVRDGTQPSARKKVDSPSTAAHVLQQYLDGVDREHFVVLLLDTQNQIIGIQMANGLPLKTDEQLVSVRIFDAQHVRAALHPLRRHRPLRDLPEQLIYALPELEEDVPDRTGTHPRRG